jgi:hypothetical protein
VGTASPFPRFTEARQQKDEEGDAILDLVLKHPDAINATYVRKQIKHLKHVSETLAKTTEKHLKTFATRMQHQIKTFATYA